MRLKQQYRYHFKPQTRALPWHTYTHISPLSQPQYRDLFTRFRNDTPNPPAGSVHRNAGLLPTSRSKTHNSPNITAIRNLNNVTAHITSRMHTHLLTHTRPRKPYIAVRRGHVHTFHPFASRTRMRGGEVGLVIGRMQREAASGSYNSGKWMVERKLENGTTCTCKMYRGNWKCRMRIVCEMEVGYT